MNRIESAAIETLSRHPNLTSKELANLFIHFIEENSLQIIKSVQISPLCWRKEYLKLKRRKRGFKRESVKKLNFINSILNFQSYAQWASDYIEAGYGEVCDLTGSKIPSTMCNTLKSIGVEDGYSGTVAIPFPSKMDICILKPPFLEESTPKKPGLIESAEFLRYDLVRRVAKVANKFSHGKVSKVQLDHDEFYGEILKVEVNLDAREALRLWVKLLKKFEGLEGAIICVKWLGKMDISEKEAGEYIAKIMLKSGILPIALPSFDAVKAVREGRV